jgi:uncharacterized protein YeaO (DUF488 family)
MSARIPPSAIRLKRAYDPPAPDDGTRVLVDRLWPRGLTKAAAAIDRWPRALAPSTELRRWIHADPARWDAFRARYAAELAGCASELDALRDLARSGPITLVFSARDAERNNATVLREVLLGD